VTGRGVVGLDIGVSGGRGVVPLGPVNSARNAPRGVTGVSTIIGGRAGVCGGESVLTPTEGTGFRGDKVCGSDEGTVLGTKMGTSVLGGEKSGTVIEREEG
jgi:hypothetical protein